MARYKKPVGHRLRIIELLEKQGKTQAKFMRDLNDKCKILGLPPILSSGYNYFNRSTLDLKRLGVIKKLLGVTTDELIASIEEENTEDEKEEERELVQAC